MEKFTPIAMRCNQEQFEAIKPKLEGLTVGAISDFRYMPYLINNRFSEQNNITNYAKNDLDEQEIHETWNEETFLRACGIEVDTFTITKEQILQLNSFNNYDCGVALKEWFPSVFETKLEVGKWYKKKNEKGCTYAFFQGFDIETYGISHYGDWVEGAVWFNKKGDVVFDNFGKNLEHLTPATPEEVKTALVNEAKKRGFKEGNYKCLRGETVFGCERIYYNEKMNELRITNESRYNVVFKDGKWAEIFTQPIKMTVAEVEAKLGYPVEIVK